MSGIRSFLSGLVVGGLFCAAIALVIALFNPPPVLKPIEPLEMADPLIPNVDDTISDQSNQVDAQETTTAMSGASSGLPVIEAPQVEASDAPRQPVAATEQLPELETTSPNPVTTARGPAVAQAPTGREADSQPQKPGTDLDARQIDDEAPGINQPIIEVAPSPNVVVASNPVANTQTETPSQPATTVSQASAADPTAPEAVPNTSEDSQVSATAAPGAIETEAQEAPVETQTQEAVPPTPVQSGPAFDAFAVDVPLDRSKPFLAIVLMDAGADGIAQNELLGIDVPVTFAVDPSTSDARRSEAAFRDGGFEVVAIVPDRGDLVLNQRTPLDRVAPILQTYFENVPGAVAVIDRPLGDFYRNIRVVNIVTQNLNRTGHGMLIHERFGINAAIGSAVAKRVPVAAVKRVIDTNRSEAAIRASLDRAVLEASKTGSAIVFGRTYPETVNTLVTWLVSNTARSITIAPLTAAVSR